MCIQFNINIHNILSIYTVLTWHESDTGSKWTQELGDFALHHPGNGTDAKCFSFLHILLAGIKSSKKKKNICVCKFTYEESVICAQNQRE